MPRRRDLAFLFAAALLLRLVYVAEIRDSVVFSSPLVDARTYDQSARQVAASGPFALDAPYYQPPLYPLLLGGLYRLTSGSYLAPRLVQAALGALTTLLVALLAAGCARAAGHAGRRAAWLGGGLAALHGPSIYLEAELLPPALLLPLLAGATVLLLRADDTGSTPTRTVGAGLLLGLAGALRPSTLLVAAGAWLWSIRGADATRRRAGTGALLALAIALPILPFTLVNGLAGGHGVLVSTNGGINLYLGNGARSDSLTAIQPGYHWDRLQIAPLAAGATTGSAESAYWATRAFREATADPRAWLGALGRKTLRLLDARETPRNTDYEDFRRDSTLLSLPLPGFGVVAPLAVLGLALAFAGNRRSVRRRSLFAIVLGAVALENLLFFVAGRYRLEAVPFLCVLAGVGADALLRRRGRIPVPAGVALAVVAALVWIDLLGEREIDETRARIQRAVAMQHAGLWNASEKVLRGALAESPDDVDAHRLAGHAAVRREDWESARHHFQRAVDGAPDYLRALLGLGTVLERLGRNDEAEDAFRRAVAADPYDADARLALGTFLAIRERWDEASEQLGIGLRIDPGHAALRTNLRNLERLRGGSC